MVPPSERAEAVQFTAGWSIFGPTSLRSVRDKSGHSRLPECCVHLPNHSIVTGRGRDGSSLTRQGPQVRILQRPQCRSWLIDVEACSLRWSAGLINVWSTLLWRRGSQTRHPKAARRSSMSSRTSPSPGTGPGRWGGLPKRDITCAAAGPGAREGTRLLLYGGFARKVRSARVGRTLWGRKL